MRRVSLLFAVLFLGLAAMPKGATPDPPPPSELPGFYQVTGTNPEGKPYQGTLQIVQQGTLYQLRWTFAQDTHAYGFGMVAHGRLHVVIFGDEQPPTIAVYSVTKQEPLTLEGEWSLTTPDQRMSAGPFPETLTKIPHPATVGGKALPKPTHKL